MAHYLATRTLHNQHLHLVCDPLLCTNVSHILGCFLSDALQFVTINDVMVHTIQLLAINSIKLCLLSKKNVDTAKAL